MPLEIKKHLFKKKKKAFLHKKLYFLSNVEEKIRQLFNKWIQDDQ